MESSSGSEWEDVDEEEHATPVTCLFCLEATPCPEALFRHCLQKHEIDIVKLVREQGNRVNVRYTFGTHAHGVANDSYCILYAL